MSRAPAFGIFCRKLSLTSLANSQIWAILLHEKALHSKSNLHSFEQDIKALKG